MLCKASHLFSFVKISYTPNKDRTDQLLVLLGSRYCMLPTAGTLGGWSDNRRCTIAHLQDLRISVQWTPTDRVGDIYAGGRYSTS